MSTRGKETDAQWGRRGLEFCIVQFLLLFLHVKTNSKQVTKGIIHLVILLD